MSSISISLHHWSIMEGTTANSEEAKMAATAIFFSKYIQRLVDLRSVVTVDVYRNLHDRTGVILEGGARLPSCDRVLFESPVCLKVHNGRPLLQIIIQMGFQTADCLPGDPIKAGIVEEEDSAGLRQSFAQKERKRFELSYIRVGITPMQKKDKVPKITINLTCKHLC